MPHVSVCTIITPMYSVHVLSLYDETYCSNESRWMPDVCKGAALAPFFFAQAEVFSAGVELKFFFTLSFGRPATLGNCRCVLEHVVAHCKKVPDPACAR